MNFFNLVTKSTINFEHKFWLCWSVGVCHVDVGFGCSTLPNEDGALFSVLHKLVQVKVQGRTKRGFSKKDCQETKNIIVTKGERVSSVNVKINSL